MRRLYPAFALLIAGFGAGCHKQAPPAPQPDAQAVAPTPPAAPALAVDRANKGKAMPDVAITDIMTGKTVKLADFKGKPVLVNLWATWCVPCVRELPTLDTLAKDRTVQVIAISEDMEGAKVVQPFLAGKGIELHPYHDNDNTLMLAYKEASLPVSILYDAEGREAWRIAGDMDWGGARAKALLAEAGI
ncbi:TlpA family protein disulfide reductase [Sphingomonas bacterium]|uniref:TlpA family protein disulfide reductase n=1 Tax=Sphingomonas bacterium TaxID=1895847 RepID=UPI0015772393|nr:TlpA disulfide reductase family protein [Sphingomonas bacterium]